MSLFERLRKNSLSEGKIDNIGYGFGKNVNTFFNQGGRAWVQVTGFVWGGNDEIACHYLRYWGKGMEFGWGMRSGGETCTLVQPIFSRMALLYFFY